MTAPAIIAAVLLGVAIGFQGYGLAMTAQQVRRTHGKGVLARRMFVRVGWPHIANVGGMVLWFLLLAWGGFWS